MVNLSMGTSLKLGPFNQDSMYSLNYSDKITIKIRISSLTISSFFPKNGLLCPCGDVQVSLFIILWWRGPFAGYEWLCVQHRGSHLPSLPRQYQFNTQPNHTRHCESIKCDDGLLSGLIVTPEFSLMRNGSLFFPTFVLFLQLDFWSDSNGTCDSASDNQSPPIDKSADSAPKSSLPPPPPPPPPVMEESLVMLSSSLHCPNERRPYVLQDQYEKLLLRQCTTSRFNKRPRT